MQKTIGIAELAVSRTAADVLVTYSLGSCVGLTLFDPTRGLGGMIHCMLPLSSINDEKARQSPAMFVDTGIAELLRLLYEAGADPRRLIAKVAGGAAPLDDNGTFRIGERNLAVLRKMLSNNSIVLRGEQTGGTAARTMYLYLDSGRTVVKSRGREVEL
ncbi:MAG: chemotaxis protein CheD [Fimbriimonadaceae bacterium]|nr:chemotaxis protein CheD [Fimbriimonadaceae bacterium]